MASRLRLLKNFGATPPVEPMPKSHKPAQSKAARRLFAERLRAAMVKTGKRGGEIAVQVGVSDQTLSEYRAGRAMPTLENFARLCRVLGEPAGWFIGPLSPSDSLEALSQRLGARLGRNRLVALTHVPDEVIFEALDAAVGRHVAGGGKVASEPAPNHRKGRR